MNDDEKNNSPSMNIIPQFGAMSSDTQMCPDDEVSMNQMQSLDSIDAEQAIEVVESNPEMLMML